MEDYNDKLIKKYNINEDDFYNFNDTEHMEFFKDYHKFLEEVKKIQEKCELVSKYFFEMDKKLLGNSADERIISPFDDLIDYICLLFY